VALIAQGRLKGQEFAQISSLKAVCPFTVEKLRLRVRWRRYSTSVATTNVRLSEAIKAIGSSDDEMAVIPGILGRNWSIGASVKHVDTRNWQRRDSDAGFPVCGIGWNLYTLEAYSTQMIPKTGHGLAFQS
jgi:hypothetical protein